ncbi:AAA family ATPase [Kitasatospora sp. NPDC087271]|uniref:AAA family ATPase n=1 Tax=Kitasatospora sp. NPDC087271 TaxID=3364067 RepID=UPI003827BFFE
MRNLFQVQAERLCRVRAGSDPVEDLFPLGYDGFLDEEAGYRPVDGQVLPGALLRPEEVAGAGVMVLLGEPGGGKTTVLRRLVEDLTPLDPANPETSDSYVWVDGSELTEYSYQQLIGRFLDGLPRKPRRSGDTTASEPRQAASGAAAARRVTIVLDQLDESPRLLPLHGALARSLNGRDTTGLRMLLACRTADWPPRLTDVLTEHFRDCLFVDLAPLSRAEAVRLVDSTGTDGEGLVTAAVSVGAGALASAPLTLELLVRSCRENDGLSGDPHGLFASGARLLAAEHDPGRNTPGPPQTLPRQRVEIAGRIAARMLLSGRRTLWHEPAHRDQRHRLDLEIDDVAGGEEETAPGDRFHVTPPAVREVLHTALFTATNRERSAFRHSSLSAYLAASYLVRRRLTRRQLKALFLVDIPGASAARIPPPLRETAAWLVALDPEHVGWLADADPESVTVHSSLVRSDAMRELIVARLLEDAAEVELSPNRWQLTRWSLFHPRVGEQLGAALVGDPTALDDDWPMRARVRVALQLARGCAEPALVAPLLALCRDDRWPATERRLAMSAAFACAPETAANELRPLLCSLEDDEYAARVDPDDELRGVLLTGLWPGHLDLATVLRVLRPPRNTHLYGSYRAFLRVLVADCDEEQAAGLLGRLVARDSGFPGSGDPAVEQFVDAVVDRVLSSERAAALYPQAAVIVAGRLRRHARVSCPSGMDDTGPGACDAAAARSGRLAFVDALVRESLSDGQSSVAVLWELTRLRWATPDRRSLCSLAKAEDFGWVLDQGDRAVRAGEPEVAEAYVTLAFHLYRHDDQEAFELLWERREDPTWARLRWIFEGVPLEMANFLRMHSEAERNASEAAGASAELSGFQHAALAGARNGDTDSFWKLLWNLQVPLEGGRTKACDSGDIKDWPGAALFSAEQLAVLPDCALHYLRAEHDHRDSWLGTDKQDLRAWAGHQSLVLLHRVGRIGEVPEHIWPRWTAAVACSPPTAPEGVLREVQAALLRLAGEHAPDDFAETVERCVRADLEHGRHPCNLRLLEPQWSAPLALVMEGLARSVAEEIGQAAGDDRAILDTWSVLLEALLPVGSEPAHALVAEVLKGVADFQEPVRAELAVRAAKALLTTDSPGAWPRLRTLTGRSESFSRGLAEACTAEAARQRIEAPLAEAELAELYRWLHSLSAAAETAYPVGGNFVDAAQQVVEWRDAIPRTLTRRCTPEALRVLKSLVAEFPWRLGLKSALVAAQNGYAAAGWSGVPLDELVGILSLPEQGGTIVLGDHYEFNGHYIDTNVIGQLNGGSELPSSEDGFARPIGLDREAAAAARHVRRAASGDDPPSGPARRDALLAGLSASRGRLVTRWIAVGLAPEQAEELADDGAVGVCREFGRFHSGRRIAVLTGDFGSGKTVALEREYRTSALRAIDDLRAPLPVHLTVKSSGPDLLRALDEQLARFPGDHDQVTVFLDGLDEFGAGRSAEILDDLRAWVYSASGRKVLATSRPDSLLQSTDCLTLPALSDTELRDLLDRVGAPRALAWHSNPEIRDALHRPLFALIAADCRKAGSDVPHSRGEFLAALVERALARAPGLGDDTYTLLGRLGRLTLDSGGAVPAGEAGTREEQLRLVRTRLVVHRQRTLTFALPVLGQYFGGQYVLDNGLPELVEFSPQRRDRWRDALTFVVSSGPWDRVTSLLSDLTAVDPGLAAWITEKAVPSFGHGSTVAHPEALECARRLSGTLDAWLGGVGRASALLSCSDGTGRGVPIGVGSGTESSSSLGLVFADPAAFDGRERFFETTAPPDLQRGEVDGLRITSLRSVTVASDVPAWPWRLSLSWVKSSMAQVLEHRAFPLPDNPAARLEEVWSLARLLTDQRGTWAHRPVPIPDVVSTIDEIFRHAPDAVLLRFRRGEVVSRSQLAELRDQCVEQSLPITRDGLIHRPYPVPDVPLEQMSGDISSAYSEEVLIDLVGQVYSGALSIYEDIVAQYLSPVRRTLFLGGALPVRFACKISWPPAGTDRGWGFGPTFSRVVVPLPLGSSSHVDVTRVEDVRAEPDSWPWSGSVDGQADFRHLRPESAAWSSRSVVREALWVFGDTPATALAYNWLAKDLDAVGLSDSVSPSFD